MAPVQRRERVAAKGQKLRVLAAEAILNAELAQVNSLVLSD
jgi:hypothetical protein